MNRIVIPTLVLFDACPHPQHRVITRCDGHGDEVGSQRVGGNHSLQRARRIARPQLQRRRPVRVRRRRRAALRAHALMKLANFSDLHCVQGFVGNADQTSLTLPIDPYEGSGGNRSGAQTCKTGLHVIPVRVGLAPG